MQRLILGYIVLGLLVPASGFLKTLGCSKYPSAACSKASKRDTFTAVHVTLEPSLLTDLAVAGALGFGNESLGNLFGLGLETLDLIHGQKRA
jgi:hypothetical protein